MVKVGLEDVFITYAESDTNASDPVNENEENVSSNSSVINNGDLASQLAGNGGNIMIPETVQNFHQQQINEESRKSTIEGILRSRFCSLGTLRETAVILLRTEFRGLKICMLKNAPVNVFKSSNFLVVRHKSCHVQYILDLLSQELRFYGRFWFCLHVYILKNNSLLKGVIFLMKNFLNVN